MSQRNEQLGDQPEINKMDEIRQEKPIDSRDIVLLIHGTFAFVEASGESFESKLTNDVRDESCVTDLITPGSMADCGSIQPEEDGCPWWLPKSDFAFHLDKYLSGIATCWPADLSGWPWEAEAAKGQDVRFFRRKLFSWSGRNNETDRREAGKRLLEGLLFLESQEKPYHIVAHSFGGAVALYAFLEAQRTSRPLNQLKSWTTLGTPFPEYMPVPTGFLGWTMVACASVLSVAGVWFFSNMSHRWSFVEHSFLLQPFFLSVFFLALLSWFALFRYSAYSAAYQVKKDRELSQDLWSAVGDKWLGIYSTKDEALNGLNLSITTLFVPVPQVAAGIVSKISLRILKILELPGNFILRYFAQGSPTVGALLAAIRPTPIPNLSHRGSLPTQLQHELDNQTKKTSWFSVRLDSKKFAEFSKTEQLTSLGRPRPGRAMFDWLKPNLALGMGLYHTSYYGTDSIRRVIASHIGARSWNPETRANAKWMQTLMPETQSWLTRRTERQVLSNSAKTKIDTITWTKRLPWALLLVMLTAGVITATSAEYHGRYMIKVLKRLDSQSQDDRLTAIDLLIAHSQLAISELIGKLSMLAEANHKSEPYINLRKEIHDRFKEKEFSAMPGLVMLFQATDTPAPHRDEILRIFIQFERKAAPAAPALCQALKQFDGLPPDTQINLLEALRAVGSDACPTLEDLQTLATNGATESVIRNKAKRAIDAIKNKNNNTK